MAAVSFLTISAGAALADDKPTADLSMDALSKYVWRGFEHSHAERGNEETSTYFERSVYLSWGMKLNESVCPLRE